MGCSQLWLLPYTASCSIIKIVIPKAISRQGKLRLSLDRGGKRDSLWSIGVSLRLLAAKKRDMGAPHIKGWVALLPIGP